MMKLTKIEWTVLLGALLGLLLVAIAVGALLVVTVRQQQAGSAALPSQQNAAVLATAKGAYPAAEALAHRWHDDARLSRVTAAWRQPTEAQLLTGKTNWAFYFYSPSARQIYIVSVVGQTIQESRISPASQTPALISPADWRVDSPQAIHDFLDHGGRRFLQSYPQSNVHLQLVVSETGQVEWSIAGLSTPDQPTVLFFLNAATGMSG